MKVHRFYVGEKRPRELQHFGATRAWVQDKELLHQWQRVLRFRVGEEIVLFDEAQDILYEISEIKIDEIALQKKTDIVQKKPHKKILLGWSMLKRDNNDWVLQKATELGVTHFAPLLALRSEKTGFDTERALKIVIEAVEQSGRSDIPQIDEPVTPEIFMNRYKDSYALIFADETYDESSLVRADRIGVLIGPEGGWAEEEIQLFSDHQLHAIHLGNFTLRAETAAIAAITKLLSS